MDINRKLHVSGMVIGLSIEGVGILSPTGFGSGIFLAMGVVIRQHNLLERKIPVWGYGLMGILLFICAAFGQVDMVNCIWRLGPVDIAGSCCCGFLLLKIYGCVMRHMPKGIFVSLLESAGFYSMWIICLHCYEKVIVPWYRLKWVFPENPLVGTVVCMILRLLLIYVMYRAVSPVIARVNRMWRKQKRKLRNVN